MPSRVGTPRGPVPNATARGFGILTALGVLLRLPARSGRFCLKQNTGDQAQCCESRNIHPGSGLRRAGPPAPAQGCREAVAPPPAPARPRTMRPPPWHPSSHPVCSLCPCPRPPGCFLRHSTHFPASGPLHLLVPPPRTPFCLTGLSLHPSRSLSTRCLLREAFPGRP